MPGHGYEPVVNFVLLILKYSNFPTSLILLYFSLMSLNFVTENIFFSTPIKFSWLLLTSLYSLEIFSNSNFGSHTPLSTFLIFPTQLNSTKSTFAPFHHPSLNFLEFPYLLTRVLFNPLNSSWHLLTPLNSSELSLAPFDSPWFALILLWPPFY